jgi:hypothetical protein
MLTVGAKWKTPPMTTTKEGARELNTTNATHKVQRRPCVQEWLAPAKSQPLRTADKANDSKAKNFRKFNFDKKTDAFNMFVPGFRT